MRQYRLPAPTERTRHDGRPANQQPRHHRGRDQQRSGPRAWPAYTAERRSTLVIGETTDVVDDPLADLRDLWDDLA
jgi:carboxylesterase type B